MDLLALALLMATLRDWFVICQRRVPVVSAGSVGVVRVGQEMYLEVGSQHAGCDDEVGYNEAGHAEREKDGLSGV